MSCLLESLFSICSAHQIINTGIVIIRKPDKHFHRNTAAARLVVGICSLADVQDFPQLFLGQVLEVLIQVMLQALKKQWKTLDLRLMTLFGISIVII